MNVLLVSQCSKRALAESRRILDQFAERRGERTWQTAITLAGLDTLHKLLRKTARKNTAVACHWIRGKDHSELLWVVGDGRQFNIRGATPTNMTARDVLRAGDENDWHSAEEIRLLASIAALFHDFGKATQAFQKKLETNQAVADPYRHEWISLRLFQAFVGQDPDEQWLARLAKADKKVTKACLDALIRDGIDSITQSPFRSMKPLACAVGWLIVSHHRVPTASDRQFQLNQSSLERLPGSISSDWCGSRQDVTDATIKQCWNLKKGLPFDSLHWCQHARKLADGLLKRSGMLDKDWLQDPYIMHLSRMALMLADHYYSSQPSHGRYGDPDYPLHANTDRQTGQLKQRLDEHLIGVEVNASRIVRSLPGLAEALPRIARHKGFRQRSRDRRFAWQDKAFDLAEALQGKSAEHGFFGVNMASTGCGKTLANGRIMYALANPQQGARFTIALGLRTLTLQTGDAYRERLSLGEEDLAVLVGGTAVRRLHELNANNMDTYAKHGSESSASLLPASQHVHFEGSLADGPLNHWLKDNTNAQRLLNAPVLTCTIDHLMPATEGLRGGHQIPPMLRLMTSDLILDEPDDFGLEDLPALTRLVNWAGMLGSRVLLSSATLPPALIQGLYEAYLEGRRHYQRHRGRPGQVLNICCAWFDEFGAVASDHAEPGSYLLAHNQFVDKRLSKLDVSSQAESRRKAQIQILPIANGLEETERYQAFACEIGSLLQSLHRNHGMADPQTGKRVSIGLVRMANIDPLVDVAKELFRQGAPEGSRIHLCVYHSKHPLAVRSAIENRLDRLLTRHDDQALFIDPEMREWLDAYPEPQQIFVVLATAVAEVGRDHDYDWGIVEPSSMRSIIQLAGRIRRHRPGNITAPNLYLLDTNLAHLKTGMAKSAFCRPGFESEQFRLKSHQLSDLLIPEQWQVMDASSRIRLRPDPDPARNLVDLEHHVIQQWMQGSPPGEELKLIPACWWWAYNSSLCGALQRKQPFRNDPLGRQRYVLLPDEEGGLDFHRVEDDGSLVPSNNLMTAQAFEPGQRINSWGQADYREILDALAERLNKDPADTAQQFGYIDLPAKGCDNGWYYHSALGFSKKR
ncbi:MAG TPA: type I-F CRISPR-associated helicase Cas3 [Pseudomonas xinjiangensis]|uniref:Type I-F CRISPR-associated helicase Cas3 n=2 Tax=root TaxID=1 RepID=A0A7V1FRF8_9GAMM|nr:type I-F CRISPR-associated helicase Cas3 [Halopseudomonas xinjiangensis]HEC47057.1 type I-F CRISPR-associated helicase Cas3 [Halopseudomonas xinjiangensis]